LGKTASRKLRVALYVGDQEFGVARKLLAEPLQSGYPR